MWAIDGTWKRVFAALLAGADVEGDLDWVVGVDSTMVRAHQHAAGPAKRGVPVGEPHDHALGRSRGGLTTKIHPAADGRCRPLAFVLTPGRAGALPPSRRAYSSRAIREHLRKRGTRAVIPQPDDQIANRKRLGRKGSRPPVFDKIAYKQRNTVERCINNLKQHRGLATRYDTGQPATRRPFTSRRSTLGREVIADKRPRSAARTSPKARGTMHVPACGSSGSMVP